MGKEDGVCEILQVVILNGKLALQGAIGDPTMLVQHGDGLAEDLIERHSGSSSWGSLHRTRLVRRIIPEHQSGLHAAEEDEACHGFTPSVALDTTCTRSAHRTCRDHKEI